jgi:hypothetical protein
MYQFTVTDWIRRGEKTTISETDCDKTSMYIPAMKHAVEIGLEPFLNLFPLRERKPIPAAVLEHGLDSIKFLGRLLYEFDALGLTDPAT